MRSKSMYEPSKGPRATAVAWIDLWQLDWRNSGLHCFGQADEPIRLKWTVQPSGYILARRHPGYASYDLPKRESQRSYCVVSVLRTRLPSASAVAQK